MAKKIYIDVTGELVIDSLTEGGVATYIPAYSELTRVIHPGDMLEIRYSYSGRKVVLPTGYADLTDQGGVAYASFAALWDALTPYFASN